MIRPGLVSITFRQHTPRHIVDLVKRADLQAIEWGGDVHIPHGDLKQARLVREMTQDAGLDVSSYGSYYRVGVSDPDEFGPIVDTACELGAPTIRIWAGNQGSEISDDRYRSRVVNLSREAAALAAQVSTKVAFEFHPNTLTDTNESARALLEAINHPNMECYWQPPPGSTAANNLEGIDAIYPWLSNLHVFTWHRETRKRLPLFAGESDWMAYLARVAGSSRDRFALIEFVQNDTDEAFLQDAATLRRWLERMNPQNQAEQPEKAEEANKTHEESRPCHRREPRYWTRYRPESGSRRL